MKIEKAKKSMLSDYIQLKNQSLKEYSKFTGLKIILKNNQIKKELFTAIKEPKRIMLFIAEGDIKGYVLGSIIKSDHQNYGYIDDIFISKNSRKKGFGKLLIKEFIKILKNKKINKLRLGVSINNKKAIKFYKNLGFEIKYYGMDKTLK